MESPDLSLYEAALPSTPIPGHDPVQVNAAILRTEKEGLYNRRRLRHNLDTLTEHLHGLRRELTEADTAFIAT